MHRYDNILMCCLVSAYSLRIFSKLSAEIVSYFVCWELEVYKIREETNSSSPLYIIRYDNGSQEYGLGTFLLVIFPTNH